MAWETPAWVASILSVIGYLWIRPESFADNSLYSIVCAIIFIIDPPRQMHKAFIAWYASMADFKMSDLVTKHFTVVLLVLAVTWYVLSTPLDFFFVSPFLLCCSLGFSADRSSTNRLLKRSLQTIWKPVPELVNILGVDIPQTPDVSLAGIRSDAATLTWTKPPPNRPVAKYTIQVNGVHGMEIFQLEYPLFLASRASAPLLTWLFSRQSVNPPETK